MPPLAIGADFDNVLTAARLDAPWALRCLHDDLAPAVTGYLRLRGAAEPDDVASETFLQVFTRLDAFEGDERAFRSWVFTIGHRRLIDERRQRSRRLRATALDEAPDLVGGDAEEEAIQDLGSPWIGEVLRELSPDQRDVIVLRILADLSVEEVASIVGKRAGAVRALQHRALATIRRDLEARSGALLPARGR